MNISSKIGQDLPWVPVDPAGRLSVGQSLGICQGGEWLGGMAKKNLRYPRVSTLQTLVTCSPSLCSVGTDWAGWCSTSTRLYKAPPPAHSPLLQDLVSPSSKAWASFLSSPPGAALTLSCLAECSQLNALYMQVWQQKSLIVFVTFVAMIVVYLDLCWLVPPARGH